ncbi:MAG: subclass B3 metallo-beta-lactamase [Gammaproteobacteria bacterium]|nr:subclass B3 metallo-beta-lactamase [Gammaproteobacteria bacterium]MDP2347832.1 subclass B3 metallo-beta-lactamase [Gammaproteobacteria bacterium]
MKKLILLTVCVASPLAMPALAQTGRYDTMTMEQKIAAGAGYHDESAAVIEPFRILGNIYYVGAADVSSYLITTPEGHFLVDSGVNEMPVGIRANVEKLGFRIEDVRILLSSHAHFDHVQGHAVLQRMTGAQVMALDADADALEAGKDLSPLGFEGWEPVKVDRRLQDGESITLGSTTMTPTWVPGHTPGCTTWSLDTEDDGQVMNVAIFGCNGPNAGVQITNNPRFPDLAEQTLFGFDNLARLDPDIYLTGHPEGPFESIEHLMRVQMRPHPLLQQQPWSEMIAERRAAMEQRIAEESR